MSVFTAIEADLQQICNQNGWMFSGRTMEEYHMLYRIHNITYPESIPRVLEILNRYPVAIAHYFSQGDKRVLSIHIFTTTDSITKFIYQYTQTLGHSRWTVQNNIYRNIPPDIKDTIQNL